MIDANELVELESIISETRYPPGPEIFVPSATIADAIVKAGYAKVESQIMVTGSMQKAALLAFYKGIHDVRELDADSELRTAPQRMVDAIYAALQAWKSAKFLTNKDHALR